MTLAIHDRRPAPLCPPQYSDYARDCAEVEAALAHRFHQPQMLAPSATAGRDTVTKGPAR